MIHSQKEQRYRCKRCSKTFSATKGTALYRMHKPHALLATVVTLCWHTAARLRPSFAAFGLEVRTIYRWQLMSARHCRRLHEHIVHTWRGALGAGPGPDELRVRVVGGAVVWLASALSVTSRLWLGGLLQLRRDRTLIGTLLEGVGACGTFESLLLCTDGLSSYPKQALKVFSKPLRTGKVGPPRLLLPEGLMVAQAIKRYARRRVMGVLRRVVVGGTEEALEARLVCRQGSQSALINTAYIERFQATLRSRLAPLARRTLAAVPHGRTLEAGMWLIGTAYNFCCWHRSLRLPGDGGGGERRWIERTPAQAAGLTFSKVGRFTSYLSLPSLRLHPSGAGDDRDGCWRLLMLLDCTSTVEWGTTPYS